MTGPLETTEGSAWSDDQTACRSGPSGELTEGKDETCTAELWNGKMPEALSHDEGIQLTPE